MSFQVIIERPDNSVLRIPMNLKLKRSSKVFQLLAKLPFVPKNFMRTFWTTWGDTVYVPEYAETGMGSDEWAERYSTVLEHEARHVMQFGDLGKFMFMVLYLGPAPVFFPLLVLLFALGGVAVKAACVLILALLFPFSVGFAVGRWTLERSAYMVSICKAIENQEDVDAEINWIVDSLHTNYFYPWPKEWMREWFQAEAREEMTRVNALRAKKEEGAEAPPPTDLL